MEWCDTAHMPKYFLNKNFNNFDRKLQPKAFDVAKQYHCDWPAGNSQSLVFLSPGVYGVGKTHLVCSILNQLFDRVDKVVLTTEGHIRKLPCPAYFTSENELLRRIRQTFNRTNKNDHTEYYEETEQDVYSDLSKVSLLIVDDVGKVKSRDLTFTQSDYFNIIDERYSDDKPIILTTNLDYAELEEHIGGACADRLREMCGKDGFVKMTGKSYRQLDKPK